MTAARTGGMTVKAGGMTAATAADRHLRQFRPTATPDLAKYLRECSATGRDPGREGVTALRRG